MILAGIFSEIVRFFGMFDDWMMLFQYISVILAEMFMSSCPFFAM